MKYRYLLILIILLNSRFLYSDQSMGLWVPCESANSTLSSMEKIDEMIRIAKYSGITDLYIQVYRGNRSWFQNSLADDTPYQTFYAKENKDIVETILRKAHKEKIKVHAWFNIFRIGKKPESKIIQKIDRNVVTRDNLGTSMLDYKDYLLPNPYSKYFIYGEDGLWLDPGDERVQAYLVSILSFFCKMYPTIDGIHLDFIRFPYTVPYSPGSRWNKGIEFGYGVESVRRFQDTYKLNPFKMDKNTFNTQLWDSWRRDQITTFIKRLHLIDGIKKGHISLSAAVLAWADRAYFSSFQDWRQWLEEGLVDHIALMNYTKDIKYFKYATQTAVASRYNSKVKIGIGAYLLTSNVQSILDQIEITHQLKADGIILFAYEALKDNDPLLQAIYGINKKSNDKS